MKKIKLILFIPIILMSTINLISCGVINNSKEENDSNNNDKLINNDVSKNLTADQILYIDKININIFMSKFSNLLSNNGILNLSIFKNLLEIRDGAFMGKNISSIIFNEKISKIEKNAFKGINSLKGFVMPNSIKFVGEEAFSNAFYSNFDTTVTFNQNSEIKLIENNAFSINEKLKISTSSEFIKKLLIDSNFNANKIITNNESVGGYFNDLYVDNYLTIISSLNFNKNTVLSSLTNEKLNEELKQKFPNKNYQLSILSESSEYKGILKLRIFIDNTQQNIQVSGFNSLKQDDDYVIDKIVIDSNKWFTNLKKEIDVNNWNKDEWISYLSNLEIRNNESIQYDLLNIGDNVTYSLEYDSNKKSMFIILTTNYKKLDGSNWINESTNILNKKIGILNNTGFILKFPDKNNLYDFIKNILEIDEKNRESMINQRYSSYYTHAISGLKQYTLLNNILKIPEKYKSYINESLGIIQNDIISIEFNTIFSNDIDGILKFNYNFKKKSSIDDVLFTGVYQIDGFKKITKDDLNITMTINRTSTLFQTNLKQINNLLSKQQLQNMQTNQTIELNNIGFGPIATSINLLSDGNDQNASSKKTKFEQSIKNYSLLIKNFELESKSINFSTNYFNYIGNRDDTKGYIIKYLSISTNKSKKGKITKTHIWSYSFPITVYLGIINSNNFSSESILDMEIESNCTMTMLSNDINGLIK